MNKGILKISAKTQEDVFDADRIISQELRRNRSTPEAGHVGFF